MLRGWQPFGLLACDSTRQLRTAHNGRFAEDGCVAIQVNLNAC
jgi:hypothetical protein